MTVMWETDIEASSSVNAGGHADGFAFETLIACNTPRADANGDTFVDGSDFAIIQLCITGSSPASPPAGDCICYNFNQDQKIEQTDINYFTDCANGGPTVPWVAFGQCTE